MLINIRFTLMCCYLWVTCIASHKQFLVPCENQTIYDPNPAIRCSVVFGQNATKTKLKKMISDKHVKMIIINLNVTEDYENDLQSQPLALEQSHSYFYKKFKWQIVRLDVGQNLLYLFLKFRLLNMTLMKIGLHSLDIDIKSEPAGCLNQLSGSDFVYRVREMLLHHTEDSSSKEKEQLSVCNQVITKNEDTANFKTVCYTQKPKHQISCDYLTRSDWWEYLILFRDFIAVLVLFYAPFFIPSRFYSINRNNCLFLLPECLSVKLTKIRGNSLKTEKIQSYDVPIEQYPTLASRCPDIEKKYKELLKGVILDIDEAKILPRGYAAAEFYRVIYDKLFRCKCHSVPMQIWLKSPLFPRWCKFYRKLTWYNFFRWLMKIFLLLLVPFPWLLRLYFYYRYEEKTIDDRKNAARSLNLTLPFKGTLLNYLPPLHGSFLLLYSIYFLDLLVFGVFNCNKKGNITMVIKEALQNMKESTKLENISIEIELLFIPLKIYGVFGLILIPLYWLFFIPIILICLLFDVVPILYLIVCLLRNIIFYIAPIIAKKFGHVNMVDLKFSERFLNCIVTILFLLSIISASVLISECTCYLVTASFYGFIILILKANYTLPYLSLIFLIVFYFFETVNNVKTKYDIFQKKIIDKLLEELGNVVEVYEGQCKDKSVYTAYAAKGARTGFTQQGTKGLIWNSTSLLLFLDAQHMPHIPEKFFYIMCHLPYAGCPGSLTISYLRALKKYFTILLFLAFVFIVVRTFLGLYSVSSTNQMLATLAGGFIPLFVQKLANLNSQVAEIDTESIAFKTYFRKSIKEYSEDWGVLDFFIESNEEDVPDGHLQSGDLDPGLCINIEIQSQEPSPQETSV